MDLNSLFITSDGYLKTADQKVTKENNNITDISFPQIYSYATTEKISLVNQDTLIEDPYSTYLFSIDGIKYDLDFIKNKTLNINVIVDQDGSINVNDEYVGSTIYNGEVLFSNTGIYEGFTYFLDSSNNKVQYKIDSNSFVNMYFYINDEGTKINRYEIGTNTYASSLYEYICLDIYTPAEFQTSVLKNSKQETWKIKVEIGSKIEPIYDSKDKHWYIGKEDSGIVGGGKAEMENDSYVILIDTQTGDNLTVPPPMKKPNSNQWGYAAQKLNLPNNAVPLDGVGAALTPLGSEFWGYSVQEMYTVDGFTLGNEKSYMTTLNFIPANEIKYLYYYDFKLTYSVTYKKTSQKQDLSFVAQKYLKAIYDINTRKVSIADQDGEQYSFYRRPLYRQYFPIEGNETKQNIVGIAISENDSGTRPLASLVIENQVPTIRKYLRSSLSSQNDYPYWQQISENTFKGLATISSSTFTVEKASKSCFAIKLENSGYKALVDKNYTSIAEGNHAYACLDQVYYFIVPSYDSVKEIKVPISFGFVDNRFTNTNKKVLCSGEMVFQSQKKTITCKIKVVSDSASNYTTNFKLYYGEIF